MDAIDTPRAFCKKLIAELVLNRRLSIPLGDPTVERGFSKVLEHLRNIEQSSQEQFAPPRDQLAAVIAGLNPDPNLGTHDRFWSTLRRLQPGVLSVPNPNYPEMSIGLSSAEAEEEMSNVPAAWREVIQKSASILAITL